MNHSDKKMTVRLMFRLLPVQILLSAIGAINGMVTGLFASNFVGSTAMSAVGLYNPISMLVGAVSTVLISGSMILCGKYIGMNMPEKTQDIFSLDLFLSIAVSALFIVFHLFTALFTNGSLLTDDPAERLSLIDPDDLTKNIGIRMIYKLAGEISYQNILGLNVLSVKI